MIIDNISLYSLRVFESCYRNNSMSKAAKELFMTQPGVSQHIKQIEQNLGVILFDRINKNIVATASAKELYQNISPLLFSLENALGDINKTTRSMKGKISFGMPIEFGNNVILPYLSDWSKEQKQVHFHINYDHAQRQLRGLLDGSLDFAITDSFAFPDQIETINLARENLVLCASLDYAAKFDLDANSDFNTLKELDYITYLEDSTIVKQWFNHHFERTFAPNKRVTLMDVQGVSRLILSGLGIGILAMHMVRERKLEDKLLIFKGSGIPLYNEINLSKIRGKTQSMACQRFIEFLSQKLKERANLLK